MGIFSAGLQRQMREHGNYYTKPMHNLFQANSRTPLPKSDSRFYHIHHSLLLNQRIIMLTQPKGMSIIPQPHLTFLRLIIHPFHPPSFSL